MKNYVLLLIDSLNYSHVKSSPFELMPFLSELKKEGISCENMYSEAPYTEAALMNLICGQDVLDYGGYMFRYKDTPLTLFEAMQLKGFETFTNSYEPQCYPSSVNRGIDYCVNGVGYEIGSLWSYRLKHYSNLYKNGKMNEYDFKVVDTIVKDNLESWLKWTNDLIKDSFAVSMIGKNSSLYNPLIVHKKVKKQYDLYYKDPNKYVEQLLKKGRSHEIYSIEGFNQNMKIKNKEIKKYIRQEYKLLFKKIRKMDFKLNLKNEERIFSGTIKKLGELIRKPRMENLKNFVKASLLSINSLIDIDLYKRINKNCDGFKNSPSMRKKVDNYIEWASKRATIDRPHFAYIHVDDVHNPEIFFTYDTEDKDVIRKEKKDVELLLKEIPPSYKGSITHDLSLRYIDGIIKYFYEQLEKFNMANNTVVIICADHGFSFSGNPLRDSAVINLFLENYNIPFIITGTKYKDIKITKMCESKDIPATICDLVDGIIPSEFSGQSVLRNCDYTHLRIEYCGGGCPDLIRRELKMASFDEHYFVGTLGTLENYSEGIITEIYDLQKDPNQLNNLIRREYDKIRVKKLFETIIARKHIIKHSLESINPRLVNSF